MADINASASRDIDTADRNPNADETNCTPDSNRNKRGNRSPSYWKSNNGLLTKKSSISSSIITESGSNNSEGSWHAATDPKQVAQLPLLKLPGFDARWSHYRTQPIEGINPDDPDGLRVGASAENPNATPPSAPLAVPADADPATVPEAMRSAKRDTKAWNRQQKKLREALARDPNRPKMTRAEAAAKGREVAKANRLRKVAQRTRQAETRRRKKEAAEQAAGG